LPLLPAGLVLAAAVVSVYLIFLFSVQTSPRLSSLLSGGFSRPLGVAVGPDQRIFVTDSIYHRIVVLDERGSVLLTFGGYGAGYGEFRYPVAVAAGADGEIYVADFDNGRIQVFDAEANFLRSFSAADGRELRPTALLAAGEKIYVTDVTTHQVVVFDTEGREIDRIGGGRGVEEGAFKFPNGLALDRDGKRLFVADSNNSRIQVFTLGGDFLEILDGGGMLINPRGLAYDQQLYVADTLGHIIHIFNEQGLINSFGLPKGVENGLSFPVGIAVAEGKIYVADRENNRVAVWRY
jgi:DNA-binding beta-propeller fold protein YncE